MIVQSLCDEGSYPNNLDSWKLRVARYDLKNVVFLVQGAKQSKEWIEYRYVRKKRIRGYRIWIEIRSAIGGICDAVPFTRRRRRGYVESGLESHGGRRILWKLAPGTEYRRG